VPRGPRILVVEDDDDVLDLLVEILQSHNYNVTPARNGRDAVALIEQQRFDALFTDMRMPGVDGWDVIRAAHSRNPGILVTLVTGWASQVRREDLDENRVHALIGKPFTENEILGVLESLPAENVTDTPG
jgi:CheY-like chemotaxis protein